MGASEMIYHKKPTPGINLEKFVFAPTTNDLLKTAVDAYLNGDYNTYGPITDWDVSEITDMSNLFNNGRSKQDNSGTIDTTTFNEDISNWDVSNVIDMSSMFEGASNFSQRLT